MYIKRHIEDVLISAAKSFPALVISGARQVGKTTILHQCFPHASYSTLDRIDVLDAAQNNPEEFLNALIQPSIIDKVQYAPDLFRYVKILVDEKRTEKGRFFLTGSQRYLMMQGVDESLAGRAGIIAMLGLSMREIDDSKFSDPFVGGEDYLHERQKQQSSLSTTDIWNVIYKGDLPELYADESIDTAMYYESYIDAYLRRDVHNLAHVGDITTFNRFVMFTALLNGQQLNKVDLASRWE